MALSGSFHRNVNSHWRVRCAWRGTQSDSGNYTDITLDTYWESIDSYGTTYSSQSKSGSSTITGTKENFSFSAKLSGKQSKKVNTQTKRIQHNDEGKATVSLSASLDIELDIGGWVGTITISDSETLDTIPRKSKMTSSASWTAGSDRTVTISRASSKFNHEVEMSVKNRDGSWRWVNQVDYSTSQTSKSTGFNENGHRAVFEALDGRASAETRMVLQTFSGSTLIGSETYYGTVTAPASSDVDAINGQHGGTSNYNAKVYIDQQLKIGIKRANSKFTHTVVVSAGSFSKTFTDVGDEVTYTLTTAERTKLYNDTKDSSFIDGNIEVTTYFVDKKVRGVTNSDLDFYVREADNKPTFSASAVTYLDTNAATKTITGSDQVIVQNKSTLRVNIGSGASMKNGATFARYVISIDGQEKPLTTLTGSVDFPSIRGNTNQVLSVKVVDSRGLTTTVTKTVTVIPYEAPSLAIKATRQDLFGENTTVKLSGAVSALNNKNTAKTLQYRITNAGTGAVIKDWTTVTPTKAGMSFTAQFVQVLNVTMKFNVEARVTDNLNTTVSTLVSVEAGQPIFFIDAKNRSLGFNDFPTGAGEFKINGRITFGANMYANENSGEGFGALWLNNSDIGGVNGIFFNDVANNKGEGLLFLLSTSEAGSPFNADYNSWHIRDGSFYLDLNKYLTIKGSENAGVSVTLGAGGLTVVGAGEGHEVAYDNLVADGSWNNTTEQLVLASDNTIRFYTGLQGGWSGRKEFIMDTNGNMSAPGYISSGDNLELNGGSTLKHKNGTLYLEGKDGATMFNTGGSARIDLRDDGKGYAQSRTIYDRTTSTGANVHINGSYILHRVTSSLQYKTDVQPVEGLDYAKKILELEPKSWIDRNQMYEKMLNDMGVGEFIGVPTDLPRNFGLIAEEMVELGLGDYVMRNEEDGTTLEGIQYDRLWTLLIPIVRDQQRQIDELKSQLNAVK